MGKRFPLVAIVSVVLWDFFPPHMYPRRNTGYLERGVRNVSSTRIYANTAVTRCWNIAPNVILTFCSTNEITLYCFWVSFQKITYFALLYSSVLGGAVSSRISRCAGLSSPPTLWASFITIIESIYFKQSLFRQKLLSICLRTYHNNFELIRQSTRP